MSDFLSQWLGLLFYSITVFAAGAWIGKPLLCWLYHLAPWSKCEKCKKE